MPNDDLGQFPTPQTAPAIPPAPTPTPDTTSPVSDSLVPEFETTPDEVPSPTLTPPSPPSPTYSEAPPPPEPGSPLITSSPDIVPEPAQSPPPEVVEAQPVLAVAPTNSGSGFRTLIFAILFFAALGGLAGSAFLYQQTTQLRTQLAEITKTLNQQRTQPVITPTPTIIEIPSGAPTPTVIPVPTASISATPTSTPTPTIIPVTGSALKPLSIASSILKIGIDYQPNAQFILLKSDNVDDPQNTISKYFFRQDLNTKKYFYVLISGNSQPEIIDKNIQVTPDNNIPSLNNLILENSLGIDMDEALQITYSKCSDLAVCKNADTRAQYIQIQNRVIWQVSLFVPGTSQPMVMQINAQTKEITFRTSDFLAD